MGPIEQLVAQRLPPERAEAVREFAKAYLRRLAAEEDGHDDEALFHEVLGAFQLAASRNGAPIAVRALNPTRAEHGYEPAGSVLETNTEDLPFLLDSVSAELQARGLGIARLLHRKLQRVLAAEDLIEGSHDYKAAVSLFESFPKDELFGAPTEDLRRAVIALLGLHPDQGRVLGRLDADGRSASVIVALPKGRYDAALLERLRAFLSERFDAADVDAHEVLGEEDRVRVHFTVHRPRGGMPEVSFRELEAQILELARTWDDRAREELVARHGDERGRMLAKRWTARLPDSYKAAVRPTAAADDIANFERLFTGGAAFHVGVRNEPEGLTRIGMYRVGGKGELSQAMPILEHLGLRVVEERPTRLLGGEGETWLQDFGVLGPTDLPLDLEESGQRIAQAIAAVWSGDAESDSLNRLVITAG